jgi:hypothetical protein
MKVKIYKPTRTATQSGLKNTRLWIMEIVPDHNARSINKVTGWTSSDDTKAQLRLKFKNKNDAIKYAKDQAFEYEVLQPEISVIKKKSYASNFI